jgi:hypothetical protein
MVRITMSVMVTNARFPLPLTLWSLVFGLGGVARTTQALGRGRPRGRWTLRPTSTLMPSNRRSAADRRRLACGCSARWSLPEPLVACAAYQ